MKLEKDHLVKFYSLLVRTRKLDNFMVKSYREGKKILWFHSGVGEEAIAIGAVTFNMRDDDYVWPHLRSHEIAFWLARGVSPKGWICNHFDKVPGEIEGPTTTDRGIEFYGATVGGGFPITLGWGVAAKKRKKNQVVLCVFGDGASGRGTLHEAMNLASLWKLPIVYICHNNQFAIYTPIKDAFPRDDIADLSFSYDMPGVVVDGQDVIAVHEAVEQAVDRARKGDGPSLIECKTFRMDIHSEGLRDLEHTRIRDEKEKEIWKKRDPILLLKEKLLSKKILTEQEMNKIDQEADAEVKALDEYQQQRPVPVAEDASILDSMLYSE